MTSREYNNNLRTIRERKKDKIDKLYHVSLDPNLQFGKNSNQGKRFRSYFGQFFTTPDKEFAEKFRESEHNLYPESTLYTYRLRKQPKLFDAFDLKTRKMLAELLDDSEVKEYYRILDKDTGVMTRDIDKEDFEKGRVKLKNNEVADLRIEYGADHPKTWLKNKYPDWQDMARIAHIVKDLGYDGYVEYQVKHPNIALFKPEDFLDQLERNTIHNKVEDDETYFNNAKQSEEFTHSEQALQSYLRSLAKTKKPIIIKN